MARENQKNTCRQNALMMIVVYYFLMAVLFLDAQSAGAVEYTGCTSAEG